MRDDGDLVVALRTVRAKCEAQKKDLQFVAQRSDALVEELGVRLHDLRERYRQAKNELTGAGSDRRRLVASVPDCSPAPGTISVAAAAPAAASPEPTPAASVGAPLQVEFIFDASNSMWGRISGRSKLVIAKEVMAHSLPSASRSLIFEGSANSPRNRGILPRTGQFFRIMPEGSVTSKDTLAFLAGGRTEI